MNEIINYPTTQSLN